MKILKNSFKFWLILILVIIIGELGILAFLKPRHAASQSLESYANTAIERCRDATYKPSCYDREIPKFMEDISMEEAFGVTRIVQDKDKTYTYCHVLGHNLSAIEVKRDPSKWRDVLTRCPSGACSNGCLHGGLQEKFRKEYLSEAEVEKLKPDLITLCEARGDWRPTGLEQASCYHAMGHLTMYLTRANIEKSILLCDEFTIKPGGRDFKQICYDGVFMQIFQPLEPEDFALVAGRQPTKETVDEFCSKYPMDQKASCHSESWPLFQYDIMSAEGLEEFCAKADQQYRERCFNALFYIIAPQLHLDGERIFDFCSEISPTRRPQCFANAASRMMEVDNRNITKAVKMCNDAQKFDPDGACFEEMVLYSDYNFHRGSKEFYEVCNSLPEAWKNKCLAPGN